MKSEMFSHDCEDVTVENCTGHGNATVLKFKLGKWPCQKKLDKINRKIKKLAINEEVRWNLLINDQTIDPSDVQRFEQVLTTSPPPLHIKLVQVHALCMRPFHPISIIQLSLQGTAGGTPRCNFTFHQYIHPAQ